MEQIIINGQVVTPEVLEKKRLECQEKKGVKLVEISQNNYKIRMLG